MDTLTHINTHTQMIIPTTTIQNEENVCTHLPVRRRHAMPPSRFVFMYTIVLAGFNSLMPRPSVLFWLVNSSIRKLWVVQQHSVDGTQLAVDSKLPYHRF